jgi:hypothetical protein
MATVPTARLTGQTTYTIATLDTLPDAAITGAGLVSRAFLNRGVPRFRAACAWVQALPSGFHTGASSSLVLFEEGRGDCLTKHGVIARLADELRLDVRKHVGIYRLDETMVPGVGALLAPHGLTFVPYMHSVLRYGGTTIDLTQGHDSGRTRTPDAFDVVVPVPPESTRDELTRIYDQQLVRYSAIDRGLAALDRAQLSDLVVACTALMSARCGPPLAG